MIRLRGNFVIIITQDRTAETATRQIRNFIVNKKSAALLYVR